MTGKSCALIYKTLQSAGIIKDYLAAAYDVLHTFSLEYVAEDVIELLKKRIYSMLVYHSSDIRSMSEIH